MCALPTRITDTLTPEGSSAGARGTEQVLGLGWKKARVVLAPGRVLDHFWTAAATSASDVCPHLAQVFLRPEPALPLQLHALLVCGSLCPGEELYCGTNGAGAGTRLSLGQVLSVAGSRPVSQAVSICLLCPISGVNKCVHTLHEQSLGFLEHYCSPIWFLPS